MNQLTSQTGAADSAKHTPGPWSTQLWKLGENKTPQIVVNGKSDCIAFVKDLWPEKQGDEMRDAEMNANARLIAAAPDLLAAARSILEMTAAALCHVNCVHPAFTSIKAAHDAAKLAIAKAKGAQ